MENGAKYILRSLRDFLFCNIHFDNIKLINIKRHRICCSPLFYVVYRFLPLWRSRSWVRTNWPAALRWISLYRFNACGHKRILGHITSIRLYTRVAHWPSKSRINNSIKPHRVQHVLRHFYYTTMQKLCNFEALYRPEIQCKCHKDSPQKE